jgi:UDPglucose--hexose-1-phosphate uridylyltransferase
VVETAEHLVHPLTIPETDMAYVYQAYRDRLSEYRSRPHLRHALAFKNHGLEAGASLAHAHSQLVGFARVPRQVRQRLRLAERFFQRHRRCLICAELDQALQSGHRLVCLDPTFAALCPFAPRFPWETWIIPRRHCSHFERDGETAPAAIWQIVAGVLQRLEGIAGQLSFNLVLQTAPFDLCHEDHYHWYIMILPRFSRQAGFEWGSGCLINPLLPERAAEMLRKS